MIAVIIAAVITVALWCCCKGLEELGVVLT